jgi:hypothetical protein
MDFIIDTVAAVHPLFPLISLLKMNGKLITVGLLDKPLELTIFPLVLGKMASIELPFCCFSLYFIRIWLYWTGSFSFYGLGSCSWHLPKFITEWFQMLNYKVF